MGLAGTVAHKDTDAPRRGRRRNLCRAFASTVVSVVVVMLAAAGAQWLATGTGDGFAKARQAEPLRTVSAEATASLYPGGTGDLTLTVANDNPYDINLTRVDPNGAATSGIAACDDPGNGVSFAGTSGTWLIPRNGAGTFVLPGSVSMAETSPDACQDQRFAIPVVLSGAQRTGPVATTSTTSVATTTTTSAAPRLSLSPSLATFPDQHVGTTSTPQRFTLTNAGTGSTTDLASALEGSAATSFTIMSNTCTQLAPGGSCSIDVTARPTSTGILSAQLRISAAGEQQVAGLTVRGTQSNVVVTQTNFGSVPIGQSVTRGIRVFNSGDGTSGPFSSIQIMQQTAGVYSIAGSSCAAPLAPGAECSVGVRFTPPSAGNFGSVLMVRAEPGTTPSGAGAQLTGSGV